MGLFRRRELSRTERLHWNTLEREADGGNKDAEALLASPDGFALYCSRVEAEARVYGGAGDKIFEFLTNLVTWISAHKEEITAIIKWAAGLIALFGSDGPAFGAGVPADCVDADGTLPPEPSGHVAFDGGNLKDWVVQGLGQYAGELKPCVSDAEQKLRLLGGYSSLENARKDLVFSAMSDGDPVIKAAKRLLASVGINV